MENIIKFLIKAGQTGVFNDAPIIIPKLIAYGYQNGEYFYELSEPEGFFELKDESQFQLFQEKLANLKIKPFRTSTSLESGKVWGPIDLKPSDVRISQDGIYLLLNLNFTYQ